MSRSSDPGHFFQTSDSIATSARRSAKKTNKSGNPIALSSKILAVYADIADAKAVYVAEAAAIIRRVVLDTGNKSATYTGATAPLTCIAISDVSDKERVLFAGCWDKSIHSWSLSSRKPLRRYTGHSDFVKCVLTAYISGTHVLVSGSADASIIVWDVSTGKKLHVLKGHARGILDLALDPASVATGASVHEVVLFSADSTREIRQWHISLSAASQVAVEPILAHETSVNRLRFEDATVTDGEVEADLWTASSDKTAMHLVRARDWKADTVLVHPDFVRDVIVDVRGGWVVTACRDEEVRVWDAATGELACVYSGHYDEVTGLALLGPEDGSAGQPSRVVSVSIDGTVRVWVLDANEMKKAREEAERLAIGIVPAEEEKADVNKLTAEEEAELAELMDEDD